MKCPNPLHLKHWGGSSLPRDLLLSVEGEQPRSFSLLFSRLASVEASLHAGGVAVRSALRTHWGPGVGGLCFGSRLWRSSGSILAKIWSAIRATSHSDPSVSSVNRIWAGPLLERLSLLPLRLPTSEQSSLSPQSFARQRWLPGHATRGRPSLSKIGLPPSTLWPGGPGMAMPSPQVSAIRRHRYVCPHSVVSSWL